VPLLSTLVISVQWNVDSSATCDDLTVSKKVEFLHTQDSVI
jgi:hypothetical protein